MADVIKSQDEWNNSLQGSKQASLVVVHFLAEWAPQCSQVTDVLTELKNDKACAKVKFLQVIIIIN